VASVTFAFRSVNATAGPVSVCGARQTE
jgi:hypothetical protein